VDYSERLTNAVLRRLPQESKPLPFAPVSESGREWLRGKGTGDEEETLKMELERSREVRLTDNLRGVV
jgi:hypothetical protein